MAGTPRVSVIVPSYNKPEYLPECLHSIQAQTFEDWECIIVSDGSSSVGEIRRVVEGMRDSRFRLVEHTENCGLAAARNTGVREARGNLVICVDEDDRICPRCLEVQIRAMLESGAEIIVGRVQYFGGREGEYPVKCVSLAEILCSQPLPGCGFLMTKSLWGRVGGWDENPVLKLGREDHEWWIRVIASGIEIAFVDEKIYEYRAPIKAQELEASLNSRALRQEVKIRRYIVQKHAELYTRFPKARMEYLRGGYLREARSLESSGQYMKAVWRLWQCFFLSKQKKDWKIAIRKSIDLVVSREVTAKILAWRRRRRSPACST